jgi:aryl-alcohol dehydrogenase-like predicted oxidoreductase
MRYNHFKNADIDVSALAVGTWAIGGDNYGPVDHTEAIGAIRTMLEEGVNLIDTAPCYGNGMSEKIVGEAISGYDREKLLISTKFGLVPDIYSRAYKKDASYKNVMREIESSLMNLKTDYIDFYFIHWPDPITPIGETMAALLELKQKGYIRYIGVSNFSIAQIEEAERYGKIDVQQPPFSMVDQTYRDIMSWGSDRGIDSITYGSMGAGILSGKYREIPKFDDHDLRLTFYDTFREPKFSKIMKLLDVMDRIACSHHRPVAQVAINWSTQNELVGTCLVGVRSSEHAKENTAAFDWELTNEEIALIDSKIMELDI